MSGYSTLLEKMMHAIIAGDRAAAHSFCRDKEHFPAEAQLSIYIQGYHRRLYKVIKHTYSATHHYLGPEPLKTLVDAFITSEPSRYINIDSYAVSFKDFLLRHCDDPFAQELAFLEGSLRETYHMPETPAIEQSWLEQQTPDRLAQCRLQLRAASRLLHFTYPVSAYISAFRAREALPEPVETLNYLMILRDCNEMQRVSLEAAEYLLLTLIHNGSTLGDALASESFAPFATSETLSGDFQRWLARWISEGFFQMP